MSGSGTAFLKDEDSHSAMESYGIPTAIVQHVLLTNRHRTSSFS